MATSSNMATFSSRFPVHSVLTDTALTGSLKDTCGYDISYQNFYAQGIPIKTPNYTGTITSLSVKISMSPWQSNNYGSQTYYIWISDTKYESTSSGGAKYNTIKGKSSTTFTTTAGSGSWSKTVTVSNLSLSGNKTYYLYIHYGSSTTGNLQNLTGLTVTTNYYTVTYNNNGRGTAPSTQNVFAGNAVTLANAITAQTVDSHKVIFNGNGGTCSTTSITSKIKYTNTKWALNSASGTQYNPGGSYTPTANVTMYAVWSSAQQAITLPAASTATKANESEKYTITFNANGGNVSPTSATATKTTSYSFDKWALNSATGSKYAAGASYTPSAATTFYANWTSSTSTTSINLPVPTRTDYTFVGWASSSSATSADIGTGSITPSASATIYAVWSQNIITYSISYNYASGSAGTYKPTSATVGSYFQVSNPTRSGYDFTGWNIDDMDTTTHYYGNSTNDNSNTKSTKTSLTGITATRFKNLRGSSGTVKFTATWKEQEVITVTYAIAYNLNGGTAGIYKPTSATVDSFVQISNPSKSGTTFKGWTISGMDSSTHYYGTSTTNVTTSTATELNNITATYFKNLRSSSGTVTFTAVWEDNSSEDTSNTYTIKYVLGGGKKGTNAPTSRVIPSSTYSEAYFQIDNPTKYGYDFAGWNIEGMDTTTHYYADSKPSWGDSGATYSNEPSLSGITQTYFKQLTRTPGTTVTFTATWTSTSGGGSTDTTYTISFASGATGVSGSVNSITVKAGESVTLPNNGFIRTPSDSSKTVTYNANGGIVSPTSDIYVKTTSYTFNGWKSGYSWFGGTTYYPGDSFTPTANTTFTAQWNTSTTDTPITIPRATKETETTNTIAYTVTLNYNYSGSTNQTLDSYVINSYSNDTWTTSSYPNTTINTGALYSPTSNTTLTANWTTTTENTLVHIPTATRTGYTFKGWATSSTAVTPDIDIDSYLPTSNITLYAIWENNIYNMYINTQGGNLWNGDSYTTDIIEVKFSYETNTFIGKKNGTSFDPNNIPSKTGYTFLNYYADIGEAFQNTSGLTFYFDGENEKNNTLTGNDTTSWLFNGNATEDTFIIANYRAHTYTIKYDKNNEKINDLTWENTSHQYDLESALAEGTSVIGYTFVGWNTKADGTGTMYNSQQLVTNLTATDGAVITLYAIWNLNNAIQIYSNNSWHNAQPYIYTNNEWKLTTGHIRKNTSWEIGIASS